MIKFYRTIIFFFFEYSENHSSQGKNLYIIIKRHLLTTATTNLATITKQETVTVDEEAITMRMKQFQKGDNTDRADKRVDESCSNAGTHFTDREHESFRGALQLRLVRKGQVGLGHADGQVIEALERNRVSKLVLSSCSFASTADPPW